MSNKKPTDYPITIETVIENQNTGAWGRIYTSIDKKRIEDIGLEKAIDEVLVEIKKHMILNAPNNWLKS